MSFDVGDPSSNTDDEYLLMKRRASPVDAPMGLNLTAMMDMLTIILVYLVKLYGDMPDNAANMKDLNVVRSVVDKRVESVAKGTLVVLSPDMVMVGGAAVAGCAAPLDLTPPPRNKEDSASPCVKSLSARLEQAYNTSIKSSPKSFNGAIEVIVDSELPYEQVVNLMTIAGRVKYNKCKFITKQAVAATPAKAAP